MTRRSSQLRKLAQKISAALILHILAMPWSLAVDSRTNPGKLLDVPKKVSIQFREQASPTDSKYIPEKMGSGVALFDYGNDGRLDIFLQNGAPLNDPTPKGTIQRKTGPAQAFLPAQSTDSHSTSLQLQNAAKEISAGRFDLAEKELLSVLNADPGEYRALDLLGVVRVLQHQEQKAEDLFTQAVRRKPDFAPAHAHLGLLFLNVARTEEAIRELRETLRLDANRTDAAVALVHILEQKAQTASESGNWDEALRLLNDLRKFAPDNPNVQYEFGIVALRLSLDKDAVEAFRRTLKIRSNDALAVYNLGRAFMELSKFDDARLQFAAYIKMRPSDPSGYCALGMTLAALERSSEAREEFERSIAIAPAQAESYYRIGLLDMGSGEYDSAEKNLRHVLDREPKNAAALTALGKVEFEQKKYSEAVSLLEQAVARNNSLREAHYYLGLTLARLGRKQESSEQLEIATQLEHEEAQHRRTVIRIVEPGALDQHEPPHQKVDPPQTD